MAVLAKMKVTQRNEFAGSTRPPEHFEEQHEYGCDCPWVPGTTVGVKLNVVTDGDGSENASFAAATPSGELSLQIDNPSAGDYFETGKEYYVEIRKARS